MLFIYLQSFYECGTFVKGQSNHKHICLPNYICMYVGVYNMYMYVYIYA